MSIWVISVRAVINREHPSLKYRIWGVVQADMSSVNMLAVFAHLAQGDIPLLTASHAHIHTAYILSARLLLQSIAYTTTNIKQIFENCGILNEPERCSLC